MEGQRPAPPPKRDSLSRTLQHLCIPCTGHLTTTKFISVIAIIATCVFGLIIFSMRDSSIFFPSVYPVGIASEDIDDFRIRDNGGCTLQKVNDMRVFPQEPRKTFANNDKTKKFPNVIIIGARKAGTRALLEYLAIHPHIAAAQKEMHFFSDEKNYARGMDWYRAQMPFSRPDQLTIEKTPNYLISNVTPARVHRMNSSILLLLTLRNPVTRAISDYTQILSNRNARGQASKDFASMALDNRTGQVKTNYKPIMISTYHLHVARWLEIFPRKQLHIIDGDRLITDPLAELLDVETFLGLEKFYNNDVIYFNATRGFYCRRWEVEGILHNACLGASKGRQHPPVEQWVRNKLNQYFYMHNEKLFRMIGQRFNWS